MVACINRGHNSKLFKNYQSTSWSLNFSSCCNLTFKAASLQDVRKLVLSISETVGSCYCFTAAMWFSNQYMFVLVLIVVLVFVCLGIETLRPFIERNTRYSKIELSLSLCVDKVN